MTETLDRIKVLIVEDSPDQRLLFRRYFEKAGCDVQVAGSAEEAIVLYEGAVPELVVVDLVLPGMDGFAFAQRVRADVPDCTLVITSVLNVEDFPAADAVLPKPVTARHVRDVLRQCIPAWRDPR